MAYSNLDFTNTPIRFVTDTAAAAGGLGLTYAGVITGWASAFAAVLTAAWFIYQMYDLWDRRRKRREASKKRKR
jgi:hypothetical protein